MTCISQRSAGEANGGLPCCGLLIDTGWPDNEGRDAEARRYSVGSTAFQHQAESRTTALLRWRIAILVSVAIAISYLDRQTLPVAVTAIARDIPAYQPAVFRAAISFLVFLRLDVRGRRKAGGRLGHPHWIRGHHGVLVAGQREPCSGHEFRHADGQPISAWPGRRRRVSRGHPRRGRMVCGQGPGHRDGHHQCRDIGGGGERASADRCDSELCRLALDFCRHRRSRIVVDVVVDLLLFSAGESSRAGARAICFRGFQPTCAGSTCCEFASPGDW